MQLAGRAKPGSQGLRSLWEGRGGPDGTRSIRFVSRGFREANREGRTYPF